MAAEREPCPNGPDCKVCKAQNAIRIAGLARQAKDYGLHLVTDADLRVLEALKQVSRSELEWAITPSVQLNYELRDALQAELARRGEKP